MGILMHLNKLQSPSTESNRSKMAFIRGQVEGDDQAKEYTNEDDAECTADLFCGRAGVRGAGLLGLVGRQLCLVLLQGLLCGL